MRNLIALLAIGAACLIPAHAQTPLRVQPTSVTGEARMVTFPYDEDRTYLVLVRPRNNTHLRFAPTERVTYVSAGDSQAFIVTVPKSREFVEIKPKFENVTTNLLVVTTERQYHIDLQSTAEGKKWYMRVAWQLGTSEQVDETQQAAEQRTARQASAARPGAAAVAVEEEDLLSNVDPAKLRFGYSVQGDASFRPSQVFDDGTHTYVRMPEGLQELPALFMRTPDSDDVALVNYSVRPPYLVVQRTMEKFTLKLGKAEVKVERDVPKRGFFSRGTNPRS
ncbi:MAG: TrbG/VirB9 family P-type conjugative transfer protein [Burkholderiales bacterium]|jgi:P-type conjugative transfer protein TrbG